MSIERSANVAATVLMVLGTLYFLGHVLAAWLRGSFEAVTG